MAVMEGVLELVVNVLVMGVLVVRVVVMGALVLVPDCLVALVADALHIGGDVLLVDTVVVFLQTLEPDELEEEI